MTSTATTAHTTTTTTASKTGHREFTGSWSCTCGVEGTVTSHTHRQADLGTAQDANVHQVYARRDEAKAARA